MKLGKNEKLIRLVNVNNERVKNKPKRWVEAKKELLKKHGWIIQEEPTKQTPKKEKKPEAVTETIEQVAEDMDKTEQAEQKLEEEPKEEKLKKRGRPKKTEK